jgi:hypothetical protein
MVLREIGCDRWSEYHSQTRAREHFHNRRAVREVDQMMKASAENPVERILVGTCWPLDPVLFAAGWRRP